jgi:membrane protease YdiL (CAAX protease family)
MGTIHRYRPTLYFVLAFAVTWINGFVLAAQSRQGAEKYMLHLFLAYMGPLLAALFMMYVFAGKSYRVDYRRRIFDLRLIDKGYLPFALLFLPMAMVAAIGISIVLGQPAEQLRFAAAFKIFDGEVIFSMILLVLVPVLEELGWRGYGVDSLASKFNLFVTSLIFGALWGLWHLPAFFIDGSYQASLWGQNPIFAINFLVGVIPLAFILNFLYYKNRRSIALLMLLHVLVNYSSEVFEANQISKCIFTLILTAVALTLVFRNRNFFFTEKMNLNLLEAVLPPRKRRGQHSISLLSLTDG